MVSRAFEVPKFVLADKFGISTKPSRNYKKIIADYLITLEQNPDYVLEKRFAPEEVSLGDKIEKLRALEETIQMLNKHLENYSEDELDKYMLPHPVMGKFTLREILYFTAYHAQHHNKQILRNLNSIA